MAIKNNINSLIDNLSRRDFLVKTGQLAAGTAMAGALGYEQSAYAKKPKKNDMIWATLLHLSYNMWEDRDDVPTVDPSLPNAELLNHIYEERRYRPALHFNEPLWNDILVAMQKAGMNMVLLDLGDGVKYESHPEIAVKNAWSVKKLKKEIAKMRKMGLEPIPKMNFSAGHDTWLKQYSRMVSTSRYYGVCKDLIDEVCQIFDTPRFFHIGMDEETAEHQATYLYTVVRQQGLWWHDLNFYVDQIERNNVRAWAFSDYYWHRPWHLDEGHHPREFLKNMPKSVVQSNWYYGTDFDPTDKKVALRVKTYDELDKHGYDQIPCGGNHSTDLNMGLTADYCKKVVDPSRLLGFLHAPWRATVEKFRDRHISATKEMQDSMKKFKS